MNSPILQWKRILLFILITVISTVIVESQGTSLLRFVSSQNEEDNYEYIKPKIYTFFYNKNPNELFQEDEVVQLWAECWSDAGWDPIVLTEESASLHPNYEQFTSRLSESGLPEKHWQRYLRYMAMSRLNNGGWFSEIYVLPLPQMKKNMFQLPKEGKFTIYSKRYPELISGDQNEWNMVTLAMIESENLEFIDPLFLQNKQDLYFTEDAVISPKYVLKSSLHSKICEASDQNILATKLSYGVSRKIIKVPRHRYHLLVKLLFSSLNKKCNLQFPSIHLSSEAQPSEVKLPIMYTFFEATHDEEESKLIMELENWKKAWQEAGWKTIILTLDDAKLHPAFNSFREAFDNAEYEITLYNRLCFYRWLAMSATEHGGWISDFDTYPLYSNPQTDGNTLPNNGNFTSYTNHVPCLISGTKSEWNRMSELLYYSFLGHSGEFWSDMLALQEVQDECIFVHETITADAPYKGININESTFDPFSFTNNCHLTRERAIHFSHASCKRANFCHDKRDTELPKWIEAWKQQCFVQT